LPGNYLELKHNDLKKELLSYPKKYWSLTSSLMYGNKNQLKFNEDEIQKDLEENLKISIKKQMISDVPIGAFLSGGVDSSTVVALMQSQSHQPVKTFTVGFNEKEYNEAKFAKKIAKHLGTNHTELYVSPKAAMEVIPKISTIYDEPFSDSSQIPTFLVSQLTKQHVKVAISGDGGDELFCGYNRYKMSEKFSSIFRFMPFSLRKTLASTIQSISPHNLDKISRFIPILDQPTNFGDKIHKGADVLNTKNFSDIYYTLCSHWKNPTEIVLNSKEPGTLLTKFKPNINYLNTQQQMMALDFLT
jgi:asparagine synthase (glutamine-hydrolysing)